MTKTSKIKYFFISLALAASVYACERNKNDVIPDRDVNFTMDIIGDIQFNNLTSIGNHVIVTAQTNNWGYYAAGFNNNGIIVYRANFDGMIPEFYACDRTCPYDYAINDLSVKVNVVAFQAICPRCSTYYELSGGGYPSSGPGKYYLKNYKTSFDGRYLRVWNY
ncbi:MAG: hypothetical protein IQL11_01505 [Bacteroidales bacterium]|nr:hypothetical protein [Bacteroidales bacterium]